MPVRECLAVFTVFSGRKILLFPVPKTEDNDEIKAFCYDWGDKRIIETGAVGDTKRRVSEVFRDLEKTLT